MIKRYAKNKRTFYFAVAIITILIIGVVLSILKFSSEDSWICDNGTWIKHGNPSASMPSSGCGVNEPNKTYCTNKSREGNICTMEYSPVCGYFDSSIKCIKYPCAQTFGNICGACHDTKVEYYIIGECPTN